MIVVLTAVLTTVWFVGSLPQITTTVIFPHVALMLFGVLPSLASFVPWLLANGVRLPGRFVKKEGVNGGDPVWTPGRLIIPGVGQLSDPSTRRAVQEATLKAQIAAAMVSFIVLAGFLPFYAGDGAWSWDSYANETERVLLRGGDVRIQFGLDPGLLAHPPAFHQVPAPDGQ